MHTTHYTVCRKIKRKLRKSYIYRLQSKARISKGSILTHRLPCGLHKIPQFCVKMNQRKLRAKNRKKYFLLECLIPQLNLFLLQHVQFEICRKVYYVRSNRFQYNRWQRRICTLSVQLYSDVTSVNSVFVSYTIIDNTDNFRIKCLS